MQFDSLDRRIRHYELLLERELDGLPGDSLPEGYRFVFYRPGDRDTWISIESSAKEFDSYEQGLIRDVMAARISPKLPCGELFEP